MHAIITVTTFFLLFYIPVRCIDALARYKPDKYEQKMSRIDSLYGDPVKKKITEENEKALDKVVIHRLELQVKTLKSYMSIKDVYPISNSEIWERIHKYVMDNLKDLLKDLELRIPFHMRYNFCLYVIPLLPLHYVLIFPGFYKLLIPSAVRKNETAASFIAKVDKFLGEVKQRSKNEVLPSFTIKKTLTSPEDLAFMKQIPVLIKKDPLKIIEWLLSFRIE